PICQLVLSSDQWMSNKAGQSVGLSFSCCAHFWRRRLRWARIVFFCSTVSLIWTVHGLVDSLFLKELAKKTHRGMEGLALRGMHTGGRVYGYRSIPVEGGGAKLTVFEPEAVVVRRIFEMSANGKSLKKIA